MPNCRDDWAWKDRNEEIEKKTRKKWRENGGREKRKGETMKSRGLDMTVNGGESQIMGFTTKDRKRLFRAFMSPLQGSLFAKVQISNF